MTFGPFEFRPDTRQLLRGHEPVPLSPKAFALLELLLERAPAAVAKDDIFRLVWKGTAVSDASLTNVIAEIRAALEDRAQKPRFVRTVHGFGYAFCGEIVNAAHRAVAAGALWRLIVAGLPFTLRPGENVIGRDPDATVRIDHSLVSRRHARVSVEGDQALLEGFREPQRDLPQWAPGGVANAASRWGRARPRQSRIDRRTSAPRGIDRDEPRLTAG